MMKRMGKKLLTCILMALCALCFVFAACGGEEKIELSFETNGGAPIESVYVDKGETYTLPTPQREGAFSFEGWYDNAEFSGTAVTEVVADVPTKYYAKWEQLYEIKLELDGGTLSAGQIFVKAGAGIYDAVKDLVPEKAGWQFGAWYMDGNELSRTAQMKAEAVTLTAHYKVGYTVELYKQNTALNGYEKDAENYVGYEYITSTPFTPDVAVTGFELVDPQPTDGAAPAIVSKVLTENASENVFRLYYNRREMDVTFAPNYPDGQGGDPILRKVAYGCETDLPDREFTADGYFLYAWSAMDAEGNTTVIENNYIRSLLINGEENNYTGKVTIGQYTSFTAQWSQGYTDMMRGVDRIYLFHEDDRVCYLERYGKYFEGTYAPNSRAVRFYDDAEDIRLEARLKDNGTFIYAADSRDALTFSSYTVENGIDEDVQIRMDAYDGLIYKNGNNQSEGTYTIDDDSNYHVAFTSGELQGQTIILRILQSRVDGRTRYLFQLRNEEEYAMPVLQRGFVNEQGGNNIITYYENNLLSIDLDGYGVATMNLGDETSTYYYTHSGDDLTLFNTSGSVYGVCKIVTADAGSHPRCYIPYTASMNVTYTADGSTLQLDGVSEAIYRPKNGRNVVAKYTYSASVFGGYIVTLATGGERYTFVVNSTTRQEGDESITEHTFAVKADGYAEYYHTDGRYINFTALIVLNDEAGKASVYGASGTSSQHVFHKVAVGTYLYNAKTKEYALTIDKTAGIEYPEGIQESPVDLHDLDTIIFGVNTVRSNNAVYAVAYWMEITRSGEGEPSGDLTTKYTGKVLYGDDKAEKDATLALVGGFAILTIEGEEETRVGAYSTSDGVTTVNIGLRSGSSRFYVELNDGEDSKTFLLLDKLLGSARERNADGTVNRNVTFEFDGKGGATLVTQQTEGDPTRVVGTVAEQPEEEGVEGTVYLFTPTEGVDAFKFVLLTTGSSTYFTRETKDFGGEYTETDGEGTLTLDGYGFRARYTKAEGDAPIEGVYSIADAENNIVRVTVGSDVYYFDITERQFVTRGSEYGAYLFIVNYANNGYLLRLDGHGTATLEKEDTVVANGSYSEERGVYTLDLTLETEVTGINAKYTGALGEVIQNNLSYNAFLVEFSNARNIYVDRTEWTVLVLDGFGNAVRFGQYGGAERGTYTVLTDDLIYYANGANTDACIYKYDTQKAEIVMQKYTAQGYYTQNLDALLFTEYGFMQFNGTTRYYYEADGEGNVTIYRRAFGETGANTYGFRKFEIGELGATLDLSEIDTEGFGEELYYSANGYAITFKRDTNDKYDGTNFKYPVGVSETDETLYPLEDLVFAPQGGDASFTVTATVRINGSNYTGVIHRVAVEGEEAEWYFTNGNLRFDLELHYQGAAAATYKITQMRSMQTVQSNMYVDVSLMLLLMLGYQMSDSYGTITFVTEYHEDGTAGTKEEGKQYITSAFGESSVLYGFELEKQSYDYDEDTKTYSVTLPQKEAAGEEDPDTHQYRLYFRLQYNSTYLMLGYRVAGYTILAYTREETLQTTGSEPQYTVTAERVLYGETNDYVPGDYYSVTIKTGTEPQETVAAPDHLLPVGDALYYVVYTRAADEAKKITAAKYYELKFTEESGSIAEGEVKPLAGVTVRELAAEVYYTEGGSYTEVLTDGETKKIVHVYYSQDYTVTECAYDDANKTFTVTTSTGRRLSIKITDDTGKKIEITEIVEEA